MNNYKQQIRQIIKGAEHDIKIAVSWFTDGDLIESLIAKAKTGIKIQLLLSADNYNLIRFNDLKELEGLGAEIKKRGSSNAIDGNFMHAKILIIDGKAAYGGSYNYTFNAISNYEVFDEFKNPLKLLKDYISEFQTSISLLSGLTEEKANELLGEIVKQYKNLTSKPLVLSTKSPSSSISLSEHMRLKAAKEDRIIHLQTQTKKLQTGEAHIGPLAKPEKPSPQTLPVKKHTYHGGGKMMGYMQQRKNGFAALHFQKYFLNKFFSFFKTELRKGYLFCTGVIKLEGCEDYEVQIKFVAGMPPVVTLPKLEVESKFDVHMYDDRSLCLYYPRDQKWTDYTKISTYTIPWIVEWIYLYEIWKLTGKWEADESPVHNNQKTSNS